MQICPHCDYENLDGEVLCVNCGEYLAIDVTVLRTQLLERQRAASKKLPPLQRPLLPLAKDGIIVFDFGGELLSVTMGNHLTLGRKDPKANDASMVDLEPYGAYAQGVSRRHAEIRRGSDDVLVLIDIGSSNGTFLNGERLQPLERHNITDSDEIRLGELKVIIYYQ